MEKYTKKANTYIMKHLLKVHPDASKLTSFNQAYEILMTDWGMEGAIVRSMHKTTFEIYRDGEKCKELSWPDEEVYVEKERDWDWDVIYKDVLTSILKERLFKRPKKSKKATKYVIDTTIDSQDTPMETTESPKIDMESLRKERQKIYMKIRSYKAKGKCSMELEKELERLRAVISQYDK